MVPGNKLRFTRNVLYRLKRDYGVPADLYHRQSETFDLTTGRQTVDTIKLHVQRAVLLPKTVARSDFMTHASPGAARDFTYGGELGTIVREVLIDKRDVKTFSFDDYVNIYVIIGGTRYEITDYEELHGFYYYLKLKATPAAQLAQQKEQKIRDRITVSSDEEDTTA